jgi:hypothetical protein
VANSAKIDSNQQHLYVKQPIRKRLSNEDVSCGAPKSQSAHCHLYTKKQQPPHLQKNNIDFDAIEVVTDHMENNCWLAIPEDVSPPSPAQVAIRYLMMMAL